MKIVLYIDGERVVFEDEDNYGYYYDGWVIRNIETGDSFTIFKNSVDAGLSAKTKYELIAENDPEEFAELVGIDNLVKWSFGLSAGPGYKKADSLNGWLALMEDNPEEVFAEDGLERTVECKHPGWKEYTIAYKN